MAAGHRRAHPGWGPPRILTQLRDGVVPLPGRSSVYRALVRCLKRVIARQLYKLLLERYDQPAVEITHAT